MGMTVGGRTVVITGASSGIGAATARLLATRGCRIVLVGRDTDRLNALAAETGGAALTADLSDPEDLDRVACAGRDADLLINNAALGWAGALTTMGAAEISRLVNVNLTAAMQLTAAVLPEMARRGVGHVVFVSSIAAVGISEEAVYSATKAGLRGFAAGVRAEFSPHNIGATTVLPAAVRTAFFARRGRPYDRRFPRQVGPEVVGNALIRGVERGAAEVFVPRWLVLAARTHGAAPGVFYRLSQRYG